MNSEYIKNESDENLVRLLKEFVSYPDEKLKICVRLLKTRVKTLRDFIEFGDYFLTEDYKIDENAYKSLINEQTKHYLKLLYERYKELSNWKKEDLENVLRNLANELNIKPAQIIHPLRIVLTGKTIGPSLFELIEALGKEVVLRRMERVWIYF
jgi:glutamyl/glutaminyl-tRNA synthetase